MEKRNEDLENLIQDVRAEFTIAIIHQEGSTDLGKRSLLLIRNKENTTWVNQQKTMDCGVEVTLEGLLSCIGFGNKLEAGTPSTVGLDNDEDETAKRDAVILDATRKQLTYGICNYASPDKEVPQKEFQFVGCDPQNCRMTSGICIDCTYCNDHCKCEGDKNEKQQHKLSTRTQLGLLCNAQQQLRKSPSLLTESSDGSACQEETIRRATSQSPSKSVKSKSKKNTRRYDMGDDGDQVYLSHRMLKEHTNRSNRSFRSETSSHNGSYMSYNSNASSSRRRYNFGDEDELYQQTTSRRTRGHRRTRSGTSNSSRRSNHSFSLLSIKKKNSPSKPKPNDKKNDPIIGKTFSFDSNNSHSSVGNVSYGDDRTRGSATTALRVNSRTNARGGGSLSSSSRSYLEGDDVDAVEPKKSWFRRRLESRE